MTELYAPAEVHTSIKLCDEPFRLLKVAADPSKTDDLWGCFVWDSTPQGHDYWEAIVEGRSVLTDAGRVYLAELYVEMMREEDASRT